MIDKRLWAYGLSKTGKFYGNETYPLEEKWEAMEKGEELAKYEGRQFYYIGRADDSNEVMDIEKIKVVTQPYEQNK